MSELEQFKKTYFEECSDLLSSAETKLISLGEGAAGPDDLNAIFRAVHSIKGGAGAFGFEALVRFAHGFETALDALRNGDLELDRRSHDLVLRGFDMLSDLVRNSRDGTPPDQARAAAIATELDRWRGAAAAPSADPSTALIAAGTAPAGTLRRIVIRFRPTPDLLRKANEPLLLVRELKSLGRLEVIVDRSHLPSLDALDVEAAYLAWTFILETTADDSAVRDVFEFVTDDAQIEFESEIIADAPADPAERRAAGAGSLVPSAANASPTTTPSAAPVERRQGDRRSGERASSIRVDIDRIDRLVNMVGEIVITQAMLSQQVGQLHLDNYTGLAQGLEQMAQHTRELQESVMSIRAQPVKSVFARMPRLVRELATSLGKDVRLEMVGEATEVDKTVIEQLSDPLVHMVRNAIDHGIEMPDARIAKGKPPEGTIILSAEHRSGRIVIEVADDGAGINRERVRQKCIERGLISADQVLDNDEIDNLIFAPGLSTADQVSNISGRGVGMDVVKRNIQELGGRVHIRSTPGQGSCFTLSLPLTLAVLDGMVLRVGADRYVLPLTNIIESLRPQPAAVTSLVNRGDVLMIRGEYVELIYVHGLFSIPDAVTDATRGLVVLVEAEGGEKVGLVVDEILGQQQVVIKSLETNYRQIDGISAATILGDGRVALILDVSGIRQSAQGRRAAIEPNLRLAS
ncbi:MAG TPA: chemotaxis protein CheA [Candidatus Sulfotelmatobacter sp.]|nr:chemotaxis protein CheA [Candidatus Sulfotelmatobacter sp.]